MVDSNTVAAILGPLVRDVWSAFMNLSVFYGREMALGGFEIARPELHVDDLEVCVHEFGHAEYADRVGLAIDRIHAEGRGTNLGRIILRAPADPPRVECSRATFEAWCRFVRVLIAGPAAQARFRIERRGAVATSQAIWRELWIVPGCESDVVRARTIATAFRGNAEDGRALLHRLGDDVVERIATDDASWKAVQVGAASLRERRRIDGRAAHAIIRRARAGQSIVSAERPASR